ncbi:hypothetical protein SK128_027153 [Halocaridina rubra]|uniref:Major facilitator superfamily associated domain-containing protein n=1 Tax=Halocaridina rubra TaxID=373956 RepID=A0AAN8X2A4_HALRR
MGVQCFGGELPFFFLSGWFIKKLGHVHAMSLVIGVFGLRYILYYCVSNPWAFLPIELLNGFTFGIFYATMTSYASHVAPKGTEATMQGIVGAAFEGIGIAIGGFVGGAVFSTVGGSKMFLFTGIFNLVFTCIHIALQLLLTKFWPESSPVDGTGSPVRYMPPSESMKPVTATDDEGEDEQDTLTMELVKKSNLRVLEGHSNPRVLGGQSNPRVLGGQSNPKVLKDQSNSRV